MTVAAISGGADSMALLHKMVGNGDRLVACHVDHGARPDAADDAAWVAQRCEELGVSCVIRRVSPRGSSEVAMRDVRYAVLRSVAQECGAAEVATGHTLDDQAETVMLRILRGTRLRGLGGMAARRPLAVGVDLVRPLLGQRRRDLRVWLQERGISWLEDPSNQDVAYARNRLRAEGLPVEAEVLARVAEAARLAFLRLDGPWDGALDALGSLPRATRRLRLERFVGGDLEETHLRSLERLASQTAGTASVSLPGGRSAVREYERLRVQALPTPDIELTFTLVDGGGSDGGDRLPPADGTPEAWFDADALRFPLTVRSRKAGDRIRPFGGAGRRKVQDVLVDAKVPRALRDCLPLVLQGEEVIWVPGVIRGEAAPIRSSTKRVLRIRRGAS